MAVKLLGNFVRYIGLSTDPKPTISVPPGSTFYETNTKDIYIYDGTAWSEANATVQTGDTINIGDLEGKDVEGATVTGRPMTIGYKNAAGKATGVSPENALPVQLTGSNLEVAAVVNVAFAGTRQQLPDKACREVTIIAKRGNTGYIYVGKGDVSSTVFGAELGELDSITLAVSNTNQIYIDASVSGEGISYVAI